MTNIPVTELPVSFRTLDDKDLSIRSDDLAPARGILIALALGLIVWSGVAAGYIAYAAAH